MSAPAAAATSVPRERPRPRPFARVANLRALARYYRARLAPPPRIEQARAAHLRFDAEAALRSLLYSGFPSGIVAAHDALQGPVLHYYLQLFFPAKKLTHDGAETMMRFLPSAEFKQYIALGYFRAAEWPRAELLRLPRAAIRQRLSSALQRGRYLQVYVDQFFIPGSPCFLRRHHRHAILLLGCDARAHQFTQLSYRASGEYHAAALPFPLLVESMDLDRHGIAKAGQLEAVLELAPPETVPDEIDVPLLKAQVAAYLAGTDNRADYARKTGRFLVRRTAGVHFGDEPGAFGAAVYPMLRAYFTSRKPGQNPDLRVSRLLEEHKQVLARVFRHPVLRREFPRLADEFAALAAKAKALHLAAFARIKSGGGFAELAPLLDEIAIREAGALSEFVGGTTASAAPTVPSSSRR